MIERHAFLYLASRMVAAAANLCAVAIFSRLADSGIYGGSLLVVSWGFVVFGFSGQWLGASFFAIYRQEAAASQVAALALLTMVSAGASGLVIATAALAGVVTWAFGGAVFAAVVGLLLFMTITEVQRTRLEATSVALMYVSRAFLIVGIGSAVLMLGGGSLALVLGLACANILASLPGLLRLAPTFERPRTDWATVRRVLDYGWPLIIAFGATGLAQNVDRLVLAHVAGSEFLGPYGATSDFLKQGFGVICEAITLTSMSVAKDAATRGDAQAVRHLLEDAFRALVGTVAFGTVFMITFADNIIDVVFGPAFRTTAHAILPWLIAANAFLVLRAFYFGQAIYFGQPSRNEVIAAAAMIIVTVSLAWGLVPWFGIYGAATAATFGQLSACAAFLIARPRLPVPGMSLLTIASAAAAALLLCAVADQIHWVGLPVRIGVKLAVLLIAAGLVIRGFNIFGLWEAARTLLSRRWPRPWGTGYAHLANPSRD